ncbi:MAG: nickel pincer cofactor biosynthesis protein LarC [Deltaproteobacteria bacterium]|nr:nickel pincer cofactor biosynthesis protein LarC [Deltaproteobacteria bacterium]
MKILYYDCFSGISGDMNLGAMIDLGVDRNYLVSELQKLSIDHYDIRISKDQRKGITGTKVDVVVASEQEHHGHHAHHRTFKTIKGLIKKSSLSDKVKTVSTDIFTKLARAEARIHGCAIDDVHFHEVGAVDSIVDIVGAAICLEYLNVDKIFCSPVQVGGGFVKCAHGTFPVPAPATAELLKGIPVKSGLVPFETTTPTGAAILAATVSSFTENLHFTAGKVGYGIGHRDTDIPNVLRVYLGETDEATIASDVETGEALLMECNIDDMNPELYEDVIEQLFKSGAQDVFLTAIIMKKSRPGVKISVLCSEAVRKAIEEILLLQTSTLGLRTFRASKTMLKREFSKRSTRYGEITFKDAYYGGKKIKSKPEYEDCKRLAKEKGVSLREIYESLKAEK